MPKKSKADKTLGQTKQGTRPDKVGRGRTDVLMQNNVQSMSVPVSDHVSDVVPDLSSKTSERHPTVTPAFMEKASDLIGARAYKPRAIRTQTRRTVSSSSEMEADYANYCMENGYVPFTSFIARVHLSSRDAKSAKLMHNFDSEKEDDSMER